MMMIMRMKSTRRLNRELESPKLKFSEETCCPFYLQHHIEMVRAATPGLIYLKGAKMIDELWPPNPNELDNAALTSILSFLGPTSTFVS